MADETVAQATGRAHRADAVVARTGGPAGNARLTAWTGVLLLILFLAELITVLDVRGLIAWHVAIGMLLIPPALVKTASTGWRIVRYYTGSRPYRQAGPPPVPMRVLGPLVVLSTLAVLGSGVVLIFIGLNSSRQALVTVLGQPVDAVAIHKATFVAWAVITGLHTLGRLIPALQLTILARRETRPVPVPGPRRRATIIVLAMIAAGVAATVTLGAVDLTGWRTLPHRPPGAHGSRQ